MNYLDFDKETFGEKEKKWFEKMRQAMGSNENECYDSVELNAMETDRDGRISKNFATTIFGKDLAYPDSSKHLHSF